MPRTENTDEIHFTLDIGIVSTPKFAIDFLVSKANRLVPKDYINYRGVVVTQGNQVFLNKQGAVRGTSKTVVAVQREAGYSTLVNPNVSDYISQVFEIGKEDPSGIKTGEVVGNIEDLISGAVKKRKQIDASSLESLFGKFTPYPYTAAMGRQERIMASALDYLHNYREGKKSLDAGIVPEEYQQPYDSLKSLQKLNPVSVDARLWKSVWDALSCLHSDVKGFFGNAPTEDCLNYTEQVGLLENAIKERRVKKSNIDDGSMNQLVGLYNVFTGAGVSAQDVAAINTDHNQLMMSVAVGIAIREMYNWGLIEVK